MRIEDTDRERSTEASVKVIFDSMRWLGLDWDEGPTGESARPDGSSVGEGGPFFQTQRLGIYKAFSDKLIAKGLAYRCYCTKEELAAKREAVQAAGGHFKYPGTCRDRKDQPDKPYVIRIKAPSKGSTGWVDRVKGRIDVPNDSQQDAVLVRADGVPLYNFGAAVDDITMGITLVARGDDHVVNTPIQILLYEGLGYKVPEFAHLPMILGADGQKLSKRHGAVSVGEYKEKGFLPDAVLNYLARLGWSHGDDEIFTRPELIQKFDWSTCGTNPARYDMKKFMHVQSTHLRMLDSSAIETHSRPYFGAGYLPESSQLQRAIDTVKTRAETLLDIEPMTSFYFQDPLVYDEAAEKKFLVEENKPHLEALKHVLSDPTQTWSREALENKVHAWLEAQGLPLKVIAQPARVALTGRTQSPGLYEVMDVLGKTLTLSRLEIALQRIETLKNLI